MNEDRPISEVFALICDYAEKHKIEPYPILDKFSEFEIKDFLFLVNGSKERMLKDKKYGMCNGMMIEPYHSIIVYNGWMVGSLNPFDGTFMVGKDGSYENMVINLLKEE